MPEMEDKPRPLAEVEGLVPTITAGAAEPKLVFLSFSEAKARVGALEGLPLAFAPGLNGTVTDPAPAPPPPPPPPLPVLASRRARAPKLMRLANGVTGMLCGGEDVVPTKSSSTADSSRLPPALLLPMLSRR